MKSSVFVLLASTAFIAFIHAVAPDHWMPFAAIGKAQKWSRSKLFWVTLISGIGHVGSSIVFSIIGILLGFSLSKLKIIEGYRGQVALWLLIGFGVAYMIWGIKHARAHKHHDISEGRIKKETIAVWTLFAIFVLGPCEPLIPLVFLGYNYGYQGVISVSIIFSVVTIVMMLAQSFLAYQGVQFIKSDIIERYAHAFAGLVIALTGVFVMAAGI